MTGVRRQFRPLAWLAHMTMLFIVVAGVSKLAALVEFAGALDSWTLVPPSARPAAAILVPLAELGIGVAWLLGLWRRAILAAGVGLLILFTVVVLSHILVGVAPKCACFGAIARYEQRMRDAWVLVGRNCVLIASLGCGGLAVVGRPGWGARPVVSRAAHFAPGGVPRARAFTIVELMIVMAIIALVVLLTIPSLGHIRREAQQLKSLSNLRSHAVMHAAYAGDHADAFLYVSDPEATLTVLRGGGATISIGYWELTQTWNVAMADDYYGGDHFPESMRVPWKPVLAPYTFYQYVWSFVARPEYWRPETRLADRSQWRRTTSSEVAFPSAKGLIWEHGWLPNSDGVFYPTPDARMAFVDGSAIETTYQKLLPFYPGEWPVFSTMDGVRGRDLAGR